MSTPGGVESGGRGSSSKLCVVCGADVSAVPRKWDEHGQYYCRACYAESRRDQRLAKVFTPPGESAPMVKPELMTPHSASARASSRVPPTSPAPTAPPPMMMPVPGERAAFEPVPEDAPVERDHVTWLMAPILLFLRPSRFFRVFVVTPAPLLTALFAWIYGVAGVMDRFDSRMAMSQMSGRQPSLPDQWGVHWAVFVIGGLLAGALYAGIGGWWYRLRLTWCGVAKPDWAMTRRVYLTASAAYAIPMLLDRVGDTMRYAKPSDAFNADFNLADALVMIALLWSIWISYVGVRTVFGAARWRACLLFGVLPVGVYGLAIVAVTIAALLSSFAPTNTRSPATHTAQKFNFQYPSNWTIETADPDYDAQANLQIDAPQDAVLRVMFYEAESTPAEEVAGTVRALKATMDAPSVSPAPEQWGQYAGKSAMVRGKTAGIEFVCRVFVTEVRPNAFLQIHEITAVSDEATVEPGFRLVRSTMRAW